MRESVSENSVTIHKKRQRQNTVHIVDKTPRKFSTSITPTNLTEQKDRFLKYGILPVFVIQASSRQVEALTNKSSGRVSHDHLNYATGILESVKKEYKSGDAFFKHSFGESINIQTASAMLGQYLNELGLDGHISIVWTNDLDCSARMMWHGPNIRYNKPEARHHTLVLKNSPDNVYLRRNGIVCLANHEIGTHYLRNLNDGLQPWFADRKTFGLRSMKSYQMSQTEEGLAALNTMIEAKGKYLFGPALLYYIACKAESMTFKELFYHLEQFVEDPERRWHYVMRVKRHLADPNDVGGLGRDQCYLEGAIEILRDLDNLELPLIYCGKLCYDETKRIKRLARLNCIKLPKFVHDIESYKWQLRWMGYINGILPHAPPHRSQGRKLKVKSMLIRAGGREVRKATAPLLETRFSDSVLAAVQNCVVIEQRLSKTPEEDGHEEETAKLPPDHRSAQDSNFIFEKLADKLNYHGNLLKQVNRRLHSANLSIKQSEKVIMNGLKAYSGVAAPPNCAAKVLPRSDNRWIADATQEPCSSSDTMDRPQRTGRASSFSAALAFAESAGTLLDRPSIANQATGVQKLIQKQMDWLEMETVSPL